MQVDDDNIFVMDYRVRTGSFSSSKSSSKPDLSQASKSFVVEVPTWKFKGSRAPFPADILYEE